MKNQSNYAELWAKLPTDVDANLQFAQLVMKENEANTNYFFGDYSAPIIRGIVLAFYAGQNIAEVVPAIMGDYFIFVAGPFKDGVKRWYQLATYKGLNDKKLNSWLTEHSHQYFSKLMKIEKNRNHMIDFVDYDTLINVIGSKSEDEAECDDEYFNRLDKAWDALNDKNKHILTVLVKNKAHWSDAWDELNKYINPKGGREVIHSWTNKRKQDALALLKARALEHLVIEYRRLTEE